MPDSEDSAPRVDWRVIDALGVGLARTTALIGGDDDTTAIVGELAVAQLQAQDSSGAKRVKLSEPIMTFTCVSDDGTIGKGADPGQKKFIEYQEETLGPDADGEVFSELWLVDTVYCNFDCGSGLTLAEATVTFYGEAENYFNGGTSGNLVLIYAP